MGNSDLLKTPRILKIRYSSKNVLKLHKVLVMLLQLELLPHQLVTNNKTSKTLILQTVIALKQQLILLRIS